MNSGPATTTTNNNNTVTWRNVGKTVAGGRKIVDNITGSVSAGEMVVVLGLSGCGKTSLLKIITGRDSATSGSVCIGGKPLTSTSRHSIGYVQQEDVFLDDLTAREHLTYAAMLRKPHGMSTEEKMQCVDMVMSEFNMTAFADSRISVLSGGEKKRCSIAAELLADTSILVLDEALSGLDSSVSYSLIYALRKLASLPTEGSGPATAGMPTAASVGIVMTVHQPSTSVFYMFDKALFMSEGRAVYYGPTASCMAYFNRTGYALPLTENEDGEFEKLPYNPADFGLELIFSKIPQEDNRQERVGPALSPVRAALDKESLGLTTDSVKVEITDPVERKKQRFKHLQFLFFRWVHKLMVDSGQKMSFLENVKRAMVEFSRFNEKYSGWMPNAILLDLYDDSRAIAEVDNIDGDKLVANSSGSLEPMTKTDFASFWYEVKVLMERTSVLSGRSFAQGPLKLTECLFISFLAGITWLQTSTSEEDVPNTAGFVFFVVAYWFYSSLFSGVLEFLPERAVVCKDYASGSHSLVSYFTARSFGTVPARMLFPALFTFVAYSMAIQDVFKSIVLLGAIFVLMLTAIAGESVGVWIGACFPEVDEAVTIATMIALAMTIFGGFYLKNIPDYISWLSVVSVLRYGYDTIILMQYSTGEDTDCDNGFY